MSRSKDIGTRAETAVERYLQTVGWPSAERRPLKGSLDQGDITGTPGICWEVKVRNRPISDGDIVAWLDETEVERVNARAEFGVLVVRRPGVGGPRAGEWWAFMSARQFVTLGTFGFRLDNPTPAPLGWPVRMLLRDAVALLHLAGYGTPNGSLS